MELTDAVASDTAAELTDAALSVTAALKKEALLKRARQVTSTNARHYLIASAKKL